MIEEIEIEAKNRVSEIIFSLFFDESLSKICSDLAACFTRESCSYWKAYFNKKEKCECNILIPSLKCRFCRKMKYVSRCGKCKICQQYKLKH